MKESPLVSIACITYNQEKYIRQCLNGFVMQKTSFPVEVVIHDDASTDSTQGIIKEYVRNHSNIDWHPILQTSNKYRLGKGILVPFVFPECKGKYIALCEGDDYWTDPYKLQKQVDFLEANPDYSLCFHNAIEHWEDGSFADRLFSNVEDNDYSGEYVFRNWFIPTASALVKRTVLTSDVYKGLVKQNQTPYGDSLIWIVASMQGKLRGMEFCASVYRRHAGSATFEAGYYNHILYQYDYWKFCPEPFKSIAADLFFQGAPQLFVISRSDHGQRAKIISRCLEISFLKTVTVFTVYFFKVFFERVNRFFRGDRSL